MTATEIKHYSHAHNAALSDIESAFLPSKFELPEILAHFYIRYLTQARRDCEAALFIAQATHSTRLPRLMADALAVGAFEGAGVDPLRFEANDYALSAVFDTSCFIDAALMLADKKLNQPIGDAEHLLRMNIMDISRMAADIVQQNQLMPFAFLLKAKRLFTARADTCRFPPLARFATAVMEGDLDLNDAWVARIASAYERQFEGLAMPIVSSAENDVKTVTNAKLLRFS
jgi:hypothetical protein